ncbi:MarR family transcriptional regulator [Leifsonia sp. H3M29-4]|uniref:MarR family winged helix-turn-helix transcriptional regulator n=1 Tax=Salinibacterium metalliresistens TaxID=3031321 RepID=UPI0023DAFF5A|nr:MarR family transcriptional regulator [Salinibacterium metalliresistens]MDF1477927.1 MarR family transcriptional regulator [Salinibacterium metalliresistens]
MSDKRSAVTAWEALFRAQVAVVRQLGSEFPVHGLSLKEYDVLFNLSRQPEQRLRIRDLNRHLLLSQPSVSRMVDRLATRGLVAKEADPGDGRGTIVCLTDKGMELFRRAAAVHAASIHQVVGSALTREELETLTRLSDKLRLGAKG